jgi:hypothetical protein
MQIPYYINRPVVCLVTLQTIRYELYFQCILLNIYYIKMIKIYVRDIKPMNLFAYQISE